MEIIISSIEAKFADFFELNTLQLSQHKLKSGSLKMALIFSFSEFEQGSPLASLVGINANVRLLRMPTHQFVV